MTKRTDIHRPASLIPSNYRHVMSFAHAGTEAGWPVPAMDLDVVIEMTKTKPFFRLNTGSCHVCGAHFRMGDVFVHEPTGEHIITGWECADRITTLDRSSFSSRHEAMAEQSLAVARREAIAEQKAAWLAGNADLVEDLKLDHYILEDMSRKLARHGSLSEAQVDLARKIAGEVRAREAAKAQRDAEAKCPVPEGVQVVRGTLVSVKWKDSDYGGALKMTVRVETPDGVYRVWGTLPSNLQSEHGKIQNNGERTGIVGAVVEFTATITRSKEDSSFGFAKRPRKDRVVRPAGPSADGIVPQVVDGLFLHSGETLA